MFIGFAFFLLLISFLIMEMGSAYNAYYDAETILQRSCNNAVEYGMMDEYRADHILKLNVKQATVLFKQYLVDDMPRIYDYEISSISGTETPPNLTVTGTLTFPTLFSQYGFDDITVKFKVESNNFRIGG